MGVTLSISNAQRTRNQSALAVARIGRLIGTRELFHTNSEASSTTLTPTCGSDAFWLDKYRDGNLVPHH
jgi:hypothetical protein